MSTKKEKEERRASLRPHPARDQIIDAMRSYGRPISPTQLSRVTGATLGSASYHVRTLMAAGIVELADEGRVRGAVEHFYALVPDADMPAVNDPVDQLLGLCDALTVPDPDGGYPLPAVLDDQARAQLLQLIALLRPEVQGVVAESTIRNGR
jgi:DNA-binding transcriptional ArsR family regulator